jgi:hypothetical protein
LQRKKSQQNDANFFSSWVCLVVSDGLVRLHGAILCSFNEQRENLLNGMVELVGLKGQVK